MGSKRSWEIKREYHIRKGGGSGACDAVKWFVSFLLDLHCIGIDCIVCTCMWVHVYVPVGACVCVHVCGCM